MAYRALRGNYGDFRGLVGHGPVLSGAENPCSRITFESVLRNIEGNGRSLPLVNRALVIQIKWTLHFFMGQLLSHHFEASLKIEMTAVQ